MNTHTHFEVSLVDRAIRACAPITGENPSYVIELFEYGRPYPWTPEHRREYTTADARALCDWLNQRVEYQTNLRFPSPAPTIGTELDLEAASATTTPSGGERGVPSASVCDADALEMSDLASWENY